jgi:6-phosphogluconate dehydrogenase
MQMGMIGLGRMGANMARRLLRGGHECVVFDPVPEAVEPLVHERAIAATSIKDLIERLHTPRCVWLMVPAAVVEQTVEQVRTFLAAGDTIIDGGNSHYVDDIRRSQGLAMHGIGYVDVGTSGGVWGLERGYCMMIGGDRDSVGRLDPIFKTLAPGPGGVARTPDFERLGASTAEQGYLHCGGSGAGHFVKMVHNGIEYGIMAAYAEGLDVLRAANAGKQQHAVDAETTPLRDPEHYQYEIALPQVAEVWRRGSVIASWLLDLTAAALVPDPNLKKFAGRVSDSGEGRWTIQAAIDTGVPTPVLTASLYERFSSRGNADFQGRLLSALRLGFGGHAEKAGE